MVTSSISQGRPQKKRADGNADTMVKTRREDFGWQSEGVRTVVAHTLRNTSHTVGLADAAVTPPSPK